MTKLADLLRKRIATTGPINVAEYMTECLLHPEYGYYVTRDPLGSAGDFTTAPEISQMFGEMVGLALAQTWMDQGAPTRFSLVEAGPGRGTLMADILRTLRAVPGCAEAAQVHLIEASPTLRDKQRELLGDTITWHDGFDALPPQPTFFVANEFFDALPVRQFVRTGPGWSERLIGEDDKALAFGLGAMADQPTLTHRLDDTSEGDLVEICPQAAPIMAKFSSLIAAYGGVGFIVDYGDWRSLGDTLQALRAHERVDVLMTPGEADLTAHVDFEALSMAANCAFARLVPQGVFLERLGITTRAQTLASQMSEDKLEAHILAHRRLTHPEEMGNLFKVLALYPNGAPLPAGCTI